MNFGPFLGGGSSKLKFWNFKFPMHMGVPSTSRNTFYFVFVATSLIFKICPSLGQKTTLQRALKPKGETWMKKQFFSKMFTNLFQYDSNDCFCCADSKNIHTMGSNDL